jgi:hypothetical protein
MLEHDPSQIPYRAGDYLDANNFGRVSITEVDDELTVSMPDMEAMGFGYQPKMVMDRDDRWYVMIDNLWYPWLFWGDDNTPSDYIVNRVMVATRIEEAQSIQPARSTFTPDRERVEAALRDLRQSSPMPSFLRDHPRPDSVPR